jgi:prepilin-type N-terminal cleavage/methylation domain-containing protein
VVKTNANHQKSRLVKTGAGFTIIELVVGLAVFALLASGVISAFLALSTTVKQAREKTVLASLASSNLEVVRNMPYSQIGTLSGNPVGTLLDLANATTTKIEGFTYKIYYEVTYIDDPADGTVGGSPNDTAPADYKQVKMSVQNLQTGIITDFLTNIVPKGLEGTTNAGAIRIKVFNFAGQPVSDADIRIQRPTSTPTLILDRQTDSSGQWTEVGLPADINNYRIVVSKTGYNSDQTYPITAENPNPVKPDVTVINGQVTEISFSIDLLANLTIKTLNEFCQNLNGVNLNIRGDKLIGTNPFVYKFNNNFSSVAGQIALTNIEWDTYTPTLLANQNLVVRGTSPIQKIDVLPGSSQTFTMILSPNSTANSLLVIVKDSATNAALENALVHLQKGGSEPQDYYGITGGSVWTQNSWTGGSGSSVWSTTSPSVYYADDGNTDVNSNPTGVRLKKTSGRYALNGWLESAIFDSGTDSSNFTTISWEPTSQTANTSLKFQLATANALEGPWNYLGPDGTASTYYTISGNNVSSAHDNQRYVRYKAFLATTDDKKTAVLTSLSLNYVSGCFTPGQVYFGDLTSGNNYDIEVTLDGYQNFEVQNTTINGSDVLEVFMSP